MSAFKRPYGWGYRKRLRIIARFPVVVDSLDKFQSSVPEPLLPEFCQLKKKLLASKKRDFNITLFKISPKVGCAGIKAELEFRTLRPANFVELLFLSDRLSELAGRIVVSVGSRWWVARGPAPSYLGLDFRGGQVKADTFVAEGNLRLRRMCFGYTDW